MRSKCLLAFAASIAVVTSLSEAQSISGPNYEVVIHSLTEMEVKMDLPQAASELYMLTAASGKEDGFASYVKNPILTCGSETSGLLRSGAKWKPERTLSGTCSVHYSVDLNFTKEKWEVGNEQAGFTDGRGTFVVSKSIFMEGDFKGPRTVKFHLPQNWALVTPWAQLPDGSFRFERDEELQDLIAFGQLALAEDSNGLFRVYLVTFGELAKQQTEVFQAIEKVSSVYNEMFSGSSRGSYIVVLIPGEEVDGEAYDRGFASTVQAPLKQTQRIVWADTIAHEMFHYWNGRQLSAAERDGELEWFNEGFTEYFANLALIRTGQVSEEDFLQKIAVNVGQYEYFLTSGLFEGVSIREAGKRKGRYRFGVYAGGWVVAFVLDQEIRRESKNQKSLTDLMRILLASPQHSALTLPAVLEAIQQLAGTKGRKLVESAVLTRESVYPENYLVELGLDVAGQSYQDEYYIQKNESASPEQLSRRKAWAGF